MTRRTSKGQTGPGVAPYRTGRQTATESIEAGEMREEIGCCLSKPAAIALGRKLRATMRGHGWRLRVFQNMGWHYAVTNGWISVHPSSAQPTAKDQRPTYHTLMNDTKSEYGGVGAMVFHSHDHPLFRSPNSAVRWQIGMARARVDSLLRVVETNERLLERGKK